MNNLFKDIPARFTDEFFETLVSSENMLIERIVSQGHTSPDTGWYDQDRNEFIVLIEGAARLELDDGHIEELAPGDWLDIPARCRHRVAWTPADTATVWLAVHY